MYSGLSIASSPMILFMLHSRKAISYLILSVHIVISTAILCICAFLTPENPVLTTYSGFISHRLRTSFKRFSLPLYLLVLRCSVLVHISLPPFFRPGFKPFTLLPLAVGCYKILLILSDSGQLCFILSLLRFLHFFRAPDFLHIGVRLASIGYFFTHVHIETEASKSYALNKDALN